MPDRDGHHTNKELDECEDWDDIFDENTPTPHDVRHALGGDVDDILREADEEWNEQDKGMGHNVDFTDSNPHRPRPLVPRQHNPSQTQP